MLNKDRIEMDRFLFMEINRLKIIEYRKENDRKV